MSTQIRSLLASRFGDVRYEPTAKRIRAVLGGTTVLDTTRAVLVWEPRRVVPSYAVPAEDIRGELRPAAVAVVPDADDAGHPMPGVSSRPVLDPSIPFAVHTADGEPADLLAAGQTRAASAFRLADADLTGYVELDFRAFDAWYEEDELNVAHPRDPFHRIDVLAGSRHVRLELDGQLLAETIRPALLFETMLPTRYYLPREDIKVELVPSSIRTFCAYKGEASYFSVPGMADVAWTYEDPRHDAEPVRGLVAFFDERIDVTVDGERVPRPVTPWS
jgi:uncharacterized protein (DUF427 family)